MIPVFKSTYSIGKSILTLDDSDKEGGPDSIFTICEENDIKLLVLVEDSMTGFVTAHNKCKEREIDLVFGLRLTCCNDISEEDNSDHKIIIFANNDDGCRLLYRIYSYAHTGNGKVDFKFLNSVWDDSVELIIPFYDSFIFNNNFHLKKCVPNFNKINPTFWIEDNGLPFDHLLKEKVLRFARGNLFTENRPIRKVKSILYKNRCDAEALQTYKILCNRNFGRAATLSCPNLDHFGSNEFCFESYLENERTTA
jgi:DNA polymerase III alpha subunit|tara:strand:- start:5963 stop:6721 length:759 start_codon:yes stop_codon:yes gene_type:complete